MKNLRFILVPLLVLSFHACGEKPCAIYLIVHNESKYDIIESYFDQDNFGAIIHPGEIKTFTYGYVSGGSTHLNFDYTLNEKKFNSNNLGAVVKDGETVIIFVYDNGYEVKESNGNVYSKWGGIPVDS
jgi:hypothetical protein